MSFLMKIIAPLLLSAALSLSSSYASDRQGVIEDFGAGGRPVGENWSRSPVYAENGMAATAHPLASQIAIDILKVGGNAVDAAIAANAALGLMEPTGNGIGGDLFAIIWDPKTQKLYGLNASGRSPAGRGLPVWPLGGAWAVHCLHQTGSRVWSRAGRVRHAAR